MHFHNLYSLPCSDPQVSWVQASNQLNLTLNQSGITLYSVVIHLVKVRCLGATLHRTIVSELGLTSHPAHHRSFLRQFLHSPTYSCYLPI